MNTKKLLTLAAMYPTPFYIFDKEELAKSCEKFKTIFGRYIPNSQFFYAMKANPHPWVLQEVARHGFGIDASSGRELKIAEKARAKKYIFTGPGKTHDELVYATSQKNVTINIDSAKEIEKLATITARYKKPIEVGIRIYTNTHGYWNKFGIPLSALAACWQRCLSTKTIVPSGIQVHMSWNKSERPYVKVISEIGSYLKKNHTLFESLKFIDLGGGFLTQESGGVPLSSYARGIKKAIDTHIPIKNIIFYFEPGRVIASPAMHIMLRVEDIKNKIAITDGGTNMIGWVDKEDPFPSIFNLSRPSKKKLLIKVFGSLCTPEDIWGDRVYGKAIAEGDILFLPNQGAYTYTYAQAFIKEFPRVYTS